MVHPMARGGVRDPLEPLRGVVAPKAMESTTSASALLICWAGSQKSARPRLPECDSSSLRCSRASDAVGIAGHYCGGTLHRWC